MKVSWHFVAVALLVINLAVTFAEESATEAAKGDADANAENKRASWLEVKRGDSSAGETESSTEQAITESDEGDDDDDEDEDLEKKASWMDVKKKASWMDVKKKASWMDVKKKASWMDVKKRASWMDVKKRASWMDVKRASWMDVKREQGKSNERTGLDRLRNELHDSATA